MHILTVWILYTEVLELYYDCKHRNGLPTYCCRIWHWQQLVTMFLFIGGSVAALL